MANLGRTLAKGNNSGFRVVGQFPVVKKIAETQRARRSAEGSNKMGCSSAILCVLRVSAFIFSSKRPTTGFRRRTLKFNEVEEWNTEEWNTEELNTEEWNTEELNTEEWNTNGSISSTVPNNGPIRVSNIPTVVFIHKARC